MARYDFKIVDVAGKNTVSTKVFKTEAAATAIKLGEFVKLKAAGSGYVIPLADGDGVIGTTTSIVGLAAADSNHTAAADGSIEVYIPTPGIVYRGGVKTAASTDTAAELLGKINDRVVIDLTSTTYTIDNTAADGATNAFVIIGGDVSNAAAPTVDFILRDDATHLG